MSSEGIGERLKYLCDPMAEAMPERERLTAFVHVGTDCVAALVAQEAEIAALRAQVDAAREFAKRHPALTLIDLAEFEAFLKVPAAIAAALAKNVET